MGLQRKAAKFLRSIQKAPERKHYLEFVTAALSIPVLLTVILVNLNALNAKKTESTPTPTPQTREIIIRDNSSNGSLNTAQPTNSPVCKKEIGPISIAYPKEGATITDNPVNFIIKYDNDMYCSVVWSYRINNGTWSEYSSNSLSVYNLPNGSVKFELRVQSTASNDQTQLDRGFMYTGAAVSVTPSAVPTLTQTP